ncbi:MAG: diguanylate cyclase [Rhodocyclales bacterium GT-UBC]|nr:MAG: diguanylate cyclase [Rhodocyclales bacterium GT-UBC]
MNQQQTVLVVDDEKQNRTLLAELLVDDCRIALAKNGAQALERAHELQPDLILLDVMMPDINGYDVIQALKADDATRQIPVIFISALDSTADEERGLDLGAVDYITKPFHPSIVRKRVRNHLQSCHHRHLLENLAKIDSLTEIANRRRYDEALENEWRRCSRTHSPLSLAIIDVDHFKAYNDHLGHAEGDRMLRLIAKKLSDFVRRPGDLVARYGGEEFVLLLPNSSSAAAANLGEELRSSIEGLRLPHPASAISPYITISLGGVTTQPSGGEVDPQFFQAADAALYEAKAGGRNRSLWRNDPFGAA